MAASGSGRLTIVKRDGSEGSDYRLNIGSLTLGSSKDCDIVLPSKGVSIKQCVITVHPTEARIKNLSEDNSTIINDQPTASKVLQHRDLIVLGNAKFRWEYANRAVTPNASSKKSIKKSSPVVKRTRNSITKRKSESSIKKSTNPTETKGRSSLCIISKPQSRQVAIVKPQTRQVVVPSSAAVQPKSKMDNKGTDGEFKNLLSSGKKKKIEKVEKFDSPVILDKNKRAALLLLTKRSPMQIHSLQTDSAKKTPKPKPSRGTAQSSDLIVNLSQSNKELPKIANLSKTPNIKVSNLVRKSIINQSKKRLSMPSKPKTAQRTPDLKNKFNTELKRKLLDASMNSHPKKRDTLRSSTPNNKQLKMTPTLKLNKTKRSLALKTPTPSPKIKNVNSKNPSPSISNLTSADATQNGATPLLSLLSSIKTALNIMNNSEIDLEEVRKTPEFRAISNKIISVEKSGSSKSPSPNILEIGRISRSGMKSANVNHSLVTPVNGASNSPIISPKHVSHELSDSTINNTVCNTPNLSHIFDFKSSTPMMVQNNVPKNTPVVIPRRSRKSLYQSNKKNSEISKAKSKTEPRKGLKVKLVLHPTNHKLNFNNCSPNSNANDIPTTPKSSLKPPPEVLKEKHSTAKKPISKRSLIDHLIRSPEVAKELFKSPVKRILSRSMTHYDSQSDDSDAQNFSNSQSLIQDTSFELLTRSKRQSNDTLNNHSSRNNRKTPPNRLSNTRGGKRSLRTPAKCNNNLSDVRGVKRLFEVNSPRNDLSDVGNIKKLFDNRRHNSPKNDLMNITGVKNIFKESKVQNSPEIDFREMVSVRQMCEAMNAQKSSNNDLTNVSGVRNTSRITRNQKSPVNDLTNVTGVKNLFKTRSSPNNDLTNVTGVKNLFKTRSSPNNDLMNVTGVKNLFKTRSSPKNDLTEISGVKELFRSNKPQKSPRNDLRNVSGVAKMFQNVEVCNSSNSKVQKKSPLNSLQNGSRVESLSKSLLKNRKNSANLSGYVTPSLIKKIASDDEYKNSNSSLNSFYNDPRDSVSPSSSVLENVGLVPSSLYKLKTENNSGNNRSRRQATINKTSFSLALSKVNFSLKKEVKPLKNNSAVITNHSTPFIESKMDISGLRQVSPILSNIPNGETSPVSRTRKRVATKRTKLNVKPEPNVKVENSEPEVIPERRTRSGVKNAIKPEAGVSPIKTEPGINSKKTSHATSTKSKNIKKKVTFALTDEKIELVKKEIRSSKSSAANVLKKAAPTKKKIIKKSTTTSKTSPESSKKKSATKKASPNKTGAVLVSKEKSTVTKTKSAKASSTETENKKTKPDSKQSAAKIKKTPTSNSKTTAKSKVKASPAKSKAQDTKKAKVSKTVPKVTKSPIKRSPTKKATRSSSRKKI